MSQRTVSEEFYIDLFEHAPDMICTVEFDSGQITSCNQTYADALGYQKEEIVGSDALHFYAPASRDAVRRGYRQLREGGQIDNLEVEMVLADGNRLDGSLSATGMTEDGEVIGSRSSVRDISALKEKERKLSEQAERLAQSNEELKRFAYLASHDLQEPLRMVASYTQLLERRYANELDKQARSYINYAVEGAERMKQLINDLLKYSRVGRPKESFGPVDLNDVLEAVEANLRVRIAESKADVVWDALPTVYGDESQLVQLFQNLIENGIKFQKEGTPNIRVDADVDDEDHVGIRVTDNGMGIDTENASRVFDIFQRLNERGEFEGTGAGLAIVKKIVQMHDGEIEVDSTPGEGSTFAVTLPREG